MIDFKKTLYDFYSDRNRPYTTEKRSFGPSSIGSCPRQIVYKKQGHISPAQIDSPAILKMQMGTNIHAPVLGDLKSTGILVDIEQEGRINLFNLDWHYYIDGVGKDFVFELKTIYGRGFDFIVDFPKDDHIFQTLFYMMAKGFSDGVILYLGRDNGYLVQHNLRYINGQLFINDILAKEALEKFQAAINDLQKARKHIDEGTLPDAPFQINLKKRPDGSITTNFQKEGLMHKNSWQCDYCAFYNACKGKEIEEFSKGNSQFLIEGKIL